MSFVLSYQSQRSDREIAWSGQPLLVAEGIERVGQKAGDGHRTDAARHRRNGTSHLCAAVKVAIAHEACLALTLPGGVVTVDAHVDYRSAWFDPVTLHHLRAAHGDHHYVGTLDHRLDVLRSRMCDCHGTAVLEQQLRHCQYLCEHKR